jgi:chemotaxis protein histidine kinase CheA
MLYYGSIDKAAFRKKFPNVGLIDAYFAREPERFEGIVIDFDVPKEVAENWKRFYDKNDLPCQLLEEPWAEISEPKAEPSVADDQEAKRREAEKKAADAAAAEASAKAAAEAKEKAEAAKRTEPAKQTKVDVPKAKSEK